MAFIVETGSGLSNATSYVSVLEADDYHALYGNTDWAALSMEQKQLSLIRASKSSDVLFTSRYLSYQTTQTQALQHPRMAYYINRNFFISSATIPQLLKDAVMEMALLDSQGTSLNPDKVEARSVTSKSLKAKGLEKTVTYSGATSTDEYLKGFLKIERILKPLLEDEDGFVPSYLSL